MGRKERELIQLEKNLVEVKTKIRSVYNELSILMKKVPKLKKLAKEYIDSDTLNLEDFLRDKYYYKWKYNLEEDE